jgi:type II secretory ATPase GspE/PulE/Tfp pilus assembly ATPase PilB-like protein
MPLPLEKLKEILVSGNYVSEQAFDKVAAVAAKKGDSIEISLVKADVIKDEKLGEALAKYFSVPFIDLKEENLQNDLLEMLPEVVARAQGSVIFAKTLEGYNMATSDPSNFEFIKHVDQIVDGRITVYYATPLGMLEAIKSYKNNIFKNVVDLIESYKVHNDENSVVLLVNQFLEYAYDNGASDVHIEPLSDNTVSIRFRIDGILNEVVRYPMEMHEKVVFRVKIMSHLRTDERGATQDGRFEYKKENMQFDVRVSILPVTNGENVVFRILSERTKKIQLEDLGLNEFDIQKVKRAITQPYGMILVVGPTGAGKTTTLYSLVQILSALPINIVTVEDPVEYSIDRVQQIQVNIKKNITFANGLRSIVRQDPDVIMVGEIRDNETASIAVNASMTGHLLFSTLHANDAATIFPRLLEMGIEPFLVASSVNVVVAQRLVRKICPHCRVNYPKSAADIPELVKQEKEDPRFKAMMKKFYSDKDLKDIKLFRGTGCKVCKHTGYLGRTAVFEVMEVDDEVRALISAKASSSSIENKAEEHGMTLMYYNGLVHLFNGVTTYDELESLSNVD